MTVYCGQTVGWIKIPLGVEVGLDPGDIVRWGPSSLVTERGTAAPIFWPTSTVAKRSPISATAELLFLIAAGAYSRSVVLGLIGVSNVYLFVSDLNNH